MPFPVVRAKTGQCPSQSYEAVKRPAVEEVPAGMLGDGSGNSAFAGAAGAINGDNRGGAQASQLAVIWMPAFRAVVTKPGKEVATLATSRISMAARALRLATANDMAIR